MEEDNGNGISGELGRDELFQRLRQVESERGDLERKNPGLVLNSQRDRAIWRNKNLPETARRFAKERYFANPLTTLKNQASFFRKRLEEP